MRRIKLGTRGDCSSIRRSPERTCRVFILFTVLGGGRGMSSGLCIPAYSLIQPIPNSRGKKSSAKGVGLGSQGKPLPFHEIH